MTDVGFLHTSDVHVPTFTRLVAQVSPGARSHHVVRPDRPMARRAVELAGEGRILMITAVESAAAPGLALLEEEAERAGRSAIQVESIVAPGAWDAFEAGDEERYRDRIAAAVVEALEEDAAGGFEVVVLAQASMAGAAELLDHIAPPVLTSPLMAVQHALDLTGS